MNFLLMDFGASRIKSALFDTDSGSLRGIADQPAAQPLIQEHGKFEVAPAILQKLFASIADRYMKQSRIDGICLCTEMHGFALMDDRGRCLSNYISWRDEREKSASEKVFPTFAAVLVFSATVLAVVAAVSVVSMAVFLAVSAASACV